MLVGKNWARLINPNMTDSELWELSQTKMGQRALELDRLEITKAAEGAKNISLRDADTGEVINYFATPEQRSRAYASPLYKSSEAFRAAVQQAEANSLTFDAAPSTGLRGGPKGTDAQSMLEAAKRDAARAHVSKLFKAANGDTPEAAIARVKILELMTSEDEATKQIVKYATETMQGEESPIVAEMKANRAAGHGSRIQLGADQVAPTASGVVSSGKREIDYANPNSGCYTDGTPLPSNSDEPGSNF
jgi:hypothetical protein